MEESNNQNEINLGALHEREKRLIFAIRNKYRFADIRIITKDGLPFRLRVAERFEDLSPEHDIEGLTG
jgi:hypothetical protein